MMGDMGRTYPGVYAEYTSVPLAQVIPVETGLPWEVLGALPEMVQTAYGSLTIGLDLQPGQCVLIRGDTSSVGLAAAALAAWRGATVLSTTRRADRLAWLKEHGVDHPLLDTGEVAPAVRELYPDGVDAALDLVGTPTLPDTLRAVRVHGTACFGGSLSNQYTVRDFSPNECLSRGVRLAGYFGDAADLPREVFQEILDAVAAGRLAFPVDRVLRRPGAAAAGPRRYGARSRRQARRPRPASIRRLRLADQASRTRELGVRAPVALHLALGSGFSRRCPQTRRPPPGRRGLPVPAHRTIAPTGQPRCRQEP